MATANVKSQLTKRPLGKLASCFFVSLFNILLPGETTRHKIKACNQPLDMPHKPFETLVDVRRPKRETKAFMTNCALIVQFRKLLLFHWIIWSRDFAGVTFESKLRQSSNAKLREKRDFFGDTLKMGPPVFFYGRGSVRKRAAIKFHALWGHSGTFDVRTCFIFVFFHQCKKSLDVPDLHRFASHIIYFANYGAKMMEGSLLTNQLKIKNLVLVEWGFTPHDDCYLLMFLGLYELLRGEKNLEYLCSLRVTYYNGTTLRKLSLSIYRLEFSRHSNGMNDFPRSRL